MKMKRKDFIMISISSILFIGLVYSLMSLNSHKQLTNSLQNEISENNSKINSLNTLISEKDKKISELKVKVNKMDTTYNLRGLTYTAFDFKNRFVEKKLSVYQLPTESSSTVITVDPFTVVTVNDCVISDTEWINISVPVYDSPTDFKGWVKLKDTVPYTKDKVNKVLSDVYLKKGTPYYLTFKDISNKKSYKADDHTRGHIWEKKKGYSLFDEGQIWYWVNDKYLIYPKVYE